MSVLASIGARLFARDPDPREALRPLWHRVVERSREPAWYSECGVADTVPGRFDMIVAIVALVQLRLEREGDRDQATVLLTELFVEDMDGQLRESGIGDMVVGKHMGRLVSSLGGRLGAFRDGLAAGNGTEWHEAVARNVTLAEDASAEVLAARLYALHDRLAATPADDILAARIPQ